MEIASHHGAIEEKTQTNEVHFYNLDFMTTVDHCVSFPKTTRFRQ